MDYPNTLNKNSTYHRLIASWVICEALLGGIIHGLKLPVSGLIVGSSAVICISLIAYYIPGKGKILKATLIVAIFKMMLSPQAPPPAYFAVFFQGLLGELLFFNRKFFRLSCILLAVLALVESGLQRIFVMTILYGNDFWKVINDFVNNLTRQKQPFNYSLWFAGIYAGIHAVVGLVVGWWVSVLPDKVEKWNHEPISAEQEIQAPVANKEKKKRFRLVLFIVWVILIGFYILVPCNLVMRIILRSFIIVLAWVFLLKPVIKFLLEKWLQKMRSKWQMEVRAVLELLPGAQARMITCWKISASEKGLARLGLFSKLIVSNLRPSIYIITGKIGSGKTTALISWAKERNDVFGILSPVVNGKRVFVDAHTGEQFGMEALEGEEDPLRIGRYTFSKSSFEHASKIIESAINKKGWLIIDEIGPLELKDEGFSRVLCSVLDKRNEMIILVIRDNDSMIKKVQEKFGFRGTTSNFQHLRKESFGPTSNSKIPSRFLPRTST